MSGIIFFNLIGSLFIFYIIARAVLIYRTRKQCQSIHKIPFQIKVKRGSWKDRIAIISTIIIWGIWIIGIIYYEVIELSLLHFAGMIGITTFFPLFRHAKIGKNGIAIAEQLISWREIKTLEFFWGKPSDFHYPNGNLTIHTLDDKHFEIIIDKQEAEKIKQLLKLQTNTSSS